jgi:PAS domain S-box-containing protein
MYDATLGQSRQKPPQRLTKRSSTSTVIELSRYVYQTLRADEEFTFSRARQDGKQSTVILVAPVSEYPALGSLARLEHEYSLRDELDPDWALRPLTLIRREGRMMLVLEDPGGEPLDRFLGHSKELGRFLRLAINLAAGVGKLHRRWLIHKDIKPANILVDFATHKVWFTGFGIASRLPRERQAAEPPEVITGTLAYMAPEQTGRMNRSIDSRSDLYSLGITFYEMLTGVLPFNASDPIEWVHCHVARQPPKPSEQTDRIPEPISAIVLKLLAKTAEERYQTAAGLEADLRKCLMEWESVGHIKSFPVGQHDIPDRLLIPEKLYGRDSVCETLLAAFDRVVATYKLELVLLSGYAGIGKSSVVHELHKVVVLPRGIFISGKFDQNKRDVPYATLAQAFQTLVRQILSKSEEEVIHWRNAILEALGPNGQLMVNLVPELELVIGKQPPVPELAPQQTQNRFEAVLRGFLAAFARKEHPLVLFLDDLQWLDPATLRLLEQLVTDPNGQHLLLIGAYRDNEVTSHHPLMLTLSAIRKTEAIVHEIELKPLSLADVNQLLGDALRCELVHARPLAELVHEKTGGNPFFTIQFLTTLAEENHLRFEAREAAWRWDVNRIRSMDFTDNVVDLMISRLKRLPTITQEALKQLACLGNSVEIDTLIAVHGGSEQKIHSDLWEAVRGGLVLRQGDSYKFLHDRIQEAAYALVAEDLRPQFHLRIGRRLLTKMVPAAIAEKIFDIVNQLNSGLMLISDPDEKGRVAELNLNAGKKAKASAAYTSACTYFSLGMALLGDGGWETQYELAFGLWHERAECEFLSANFAEAERLIWELLRRSKSKIDRAAAYQLKVLLHLMQSDNAQAVDSAFDCVRMFGIQMPTHPNREQVQIEFEEVWRTLAERSIESLIDLPPMTDPEMRAAMSLLSVLLRSAYFADHNLHRFLSCRIVNLTLKYGTTEASTHGYAWFGLILGPVFRRYDEGHRFAKLAIDLVEKHEFAAWKAGAYTAMQMALLWTRPIHIALDFLQTAFRAAIETGDVIFACYSLEHTTTDLLARGDNLEVVWLESMKARDFAQKAKFRHVADIIMSIQLFIQNMRGQDASFGTFGGTKLDKQRFQSQLVNGWLPIVICWDWILKLRARFMAGEYDGAIAAAEKAKPLLWASECHIQTVDYYYYRALTIAAIHEAASPEAQAEGLEAIRQCMEQLREWAESCRETFFDKYMLVSAEIARIEDRYLEAMRLYEESIRAARAHGFVQNEGLGNEVAARFYLDRGYETIAHAYLRNARFCYLRWGALGKVEQLDQRYPAIAEQTSLRPAVTIGAPVDQLDLRTVMKISQAVSGEIVLEKLIETLMLIAIEHAGAERGLLILQRGEEHRIEAEARTGRDGVEVQLRRAAATPAELPESLLRYVIRIQQSVILDDASSQSLFSDDPYVLQKRPRSVLCLPLVKQTKPMGALYLENNLAPRVFTPKRLAMLELLASQAAISLDHARLYADLTQENSDRRKAEEALRASEERLQDIVDNTTAVIFVKDLELRYLLVNSAFEHRHHVQRDQIRGKTDFDIHPPEVAEAVRANDFRVIEAGEPIQFEEAVPSVEGERSYVAVKFLLRDRAGKPYAVCGIATDITESKRTEEMQAAMAREREMFAKQRASQLAKANEALRGSLDALASVPELDEFIGQVMAASTRQLGAVSSMLQVINAEQKSVTLELLFQDGRVLSPEEARYPEDLRSLSLDELGFASLEKPVTVLRLADRQALLMPEGLRAYLLGLGIRTLLIIPLTSRGEANGVLSFRFTEERDFQAEELEIARALATQASLAIQLTQLAKTARQSAVLEERNRLASEIHDSLAQSFAGISMQLSAAVGAMKRKSKGAVSHVERATDLARFGLSEARRSALSLRSNVIEESGLIEALQKLVERSNIPGLLRCSFRSSGVREESLAPPVQQDLLRIAQEAISNALRHAQPTVISVSLRWDPPNLVLKIRDNGSGIVNGRSSGGGFGFANMRARAKNLGAELDVRSTAGRGTSVVVRLPVIS